MQNEKRKKRCYEDDSDQDIEYMDEDQSDINADSDPDESDDEDNIPLPILLGVSIPAFNVNRCVFTQRETKFDILLWMGGMIGK